MSCHRERRRQKDLAEVLRLQTVAILRCDFNNESRIAKEWRANREKQPAKPWWSSYALRRSVESSARGPQNKSLAERWRVFCEAEFNLARSSEGRKKMKLQKLSAWSPAVAVWVVCNLLPAPATGLSIDNDVRGSQKSAKDALDGEAIFTLTISAMTDEHEGKRLSSVLLAFVTYELMF